MQQIDRIGVFSLKYRLPIGAERRSVQSNMKDGRYKLQVKDMHTWKKGKDQVKGKRDGGGEKVYMDAPQFELSTEQLVRPI